MSGPAANGTVPNGSVVNGAGVRGDARRWRRGRRGEQPMVPKAEFTSYYGKPVLNPPVWEARDIAGYFFLGGLAGGSSLLAAGVAAACALTGRLPRVGGAATAGAALLGPCVAAYTAALIGDTAVPAWHDGYQEMPFVFTGSAAMAAGGLGLLAAPTDETGPARVLGLLGQVMEMAAFERMTRRIGMVAEPYHSGRGGAYIKAGQVLGAAGATGATLSGTPLLPAGLRRVLARGSGAALVCASAATRFGVFHAGMTSARDPKYTVVPQRERLARRGAAKAEPAPEASAVTDRAAAHTVPPA